MTTTESPENHEPAPLLGLGSSDVLGAVAEDEALLEVGRKAIEDALIDWRDARCSEFTRRNGLVIREKDGTESSVIRFGPEAALRIGLRAIAAHLKAPNAAVTGPQQREINDD